MLEWRYPHRVEQAHGLPAGVRQEPVEGLSGREYDDVHYEPWRLIVELDGRATHTGSARWRDLARDNARVVDGRTVLRYGWSDVTARPCEVAAQVVSVLRRQGWLGAPRRCSPDCRLSTMWKIA